MADSTTFAPTAQNNESYNATTLTPITYKILTPDTGFYILIIGGSILVFLVLIGSLWRVGYDGGRKKTRIKPRHAHVYVATQKDSPLVIEHRKTHRSEPLSDVLEEKDEDVEKVDDVAYLTNDNTQTLSKRTPVSYENKVVTESPRHKKGCNHFTDRKEAVLGNGSVVIPKDSKSEAEDIKRDYQMPNAVSPPALYLDHECDKTDIP